MALRPKLFVFFSFILPVQASETSASFRSAILRFQRALDEDRHVRYLAELIDRKARETSPLNPAAVSEPSAFSIDQQVSCRDASTDENWLVGTLTSVEPVKCKPLGWRKGYDFRDIQVREDATDSVSDLPFSALEIGVVSGKRRHSHSMPEEKWKDCDIDDMDTDVLRTVDKLRDCTKQLQAEADHTMMFHEISRNANAQYITKFKQAIALLAQLSDVKKLRTAFYNDHEKVRNYLVGEAGKLESDVDLLVSKQYTPPDDPENSILHDAEQETPLDADISDAGHSDEHVETTEVPLAATTAPAATAAPTSAEVK